MRKLSLAAAAIIGLSGAAFAQGDRVFDLPKLTQAPVLDGVIDGDEWRIFALGNFCLGI